MSIQNGLVVRICHGPSCGHLARKLEQAARNHIQSKGLSDHVGLEREFCIGRCSMGPNVLFERWREGKRNEKAMLSMMMNLPHPDLQIENGVRLEDLPLLIDAHYRAWRRATR